MINTRKKAILTMGLVAILWSFGGILIKLVSGHPLAIAGGRAGIAAIVMLFYVGFRFESLNRKNMIGTLFYCLTVTFFVVANKLTTSANAIFLQFTAPIWVVVFSRIFLRTKIRFSDIVAIVFVFLGLLMFFIQQMSGGMLVGNIFGLLSGVTFAGFMVSIKTVPKGKTIYPILYGNILTLLIGLPFFNAEIVTSKSLLGLVLLGLLQVALAYILYSKAIEHLSALDGMLLSVLEPVLNPIWVAIGVGENIGIYALLGGLLIILTVIIRSLYQVRLQPAPE